jgi:predicted RNA-binding Zn-ribbon protein involved in translation (DUF1610 family)
MTCPTCGGTNIMKVLDAFKAFYLFFCRDCGGRPIAVEPVKP